MAIYLTNVRKIYNYDTDLKYAIMRSVKPMSGVTQVEALAPSWELFKTYRSLSVNNEWNRETFNSIYVPRFIEEMCQQRALSVMRKIVHCNSVGLNIALACSCYNEDMCHRSIVGGILQGLGCEVIKETTNDYLKYYEMWVMK